MTDDTKTQLLNKLADSAMVLASQTAWDQITLSDLCAGGGVTLVNCATMSLTKADVTAHLDVRLDQAMLAAQTKVDRTQCVRDRVFEVAMSRFDAMEDDRPAWASIFAGEQQDRVAAFARRARRLRAGAWALEASGVSAGDLGGVGRAIGLARVFRLCEKVWLEDGADLAKTMARLDQELRKGEEWVGRANSVSAFFGR